VEAEIDLATRMASWWKLRKALAAAKEKAQRFERAGFQLLP
jgi:hypothetical protein